jgi:prepilin-type N-terminal cleavage/methylation domain-containing protein
MVRRAHSDGFSLVEVVVALMFLGVALSALARLSVSITRLHASSAFRTAAVVLASRQINEAVAARCGGFVPAVITAGPYRVTTNRRLEGLGQSIEVVVQSAISGAFPPDTFHTRVAC